MQRALNCRRWYSGKNTWQSFSVATAQCSNVDNCLTAVPSMPIAHRDHVIVAGVDWARLHDLRPFPLSAVIASAKWRLTALTRLAGRFSGAALSLMNHWSVKTL